MGWTIARGDGLLRLVAGQGALVIVGFSFSQFCALARNSLLGYWLSKGDFGVAAALTITLTLVETLGDIGADRLILQAPDGGDRRMLASAHAVQVLRGLLTGLALYLLAAPTAAYFRLEMWQHLFQAIAIVPVVKGFLHFDQRQRQRSLDNRDFVAIDAVSQAVALAATPLLLGSDPTPATVVWIALIQAMVAVFASHALARERWHIVFDRACLLRFLSFGWPIWASAIPLIAVYQLDRMLVGRYLGVEALAGYTAAFMIAMIPGLLAARIGNSLMLPLLSGAEAGMFRQRYRLLLDATVLMAAGYLCAFLIAGGAIVSLAFGPAYGDLNAVVGLLAAMWAIRMIQAVPGMALLSGGNSRPLLWAGMVRAAALPFVFLAVRNGAGLEAVAAIGIAAEIGSFVVVCWHLNRWQPGLAATTLRRLAVVLPLAACIGLAMQFAAIGSPSRLLVIVVAGAASALLCAVGLFAMPALRRLSRKVVAAG